MLTDSNNSGGGSAEQAPANRTPRPLWRIVLIFVLVFGIEQFGWNAAKGGVVEWAVIHVGTVLPATAAVTLITPGIEARAQGASIKAPGGGLNILNGCDGMEVMFLLVAAFLAIRMDLKARLVGLVLGIGLVFMANQVRILALFYAFRADRALFDVLHTTVLPVVLVSIVALYFYAFLHRCRVRLA